MTKFFKEATNKRFF